MLQISKCTEYVTNNWSIEVRCSFSSHCVTAGFRRHTHKMKMHVRKKTINQLHIYTGKRWWNTHDSDMPNEQVPHPHTHTRLTALCPGLPRWASTRKVKPIWILLKQETVSGSGISWAIYKSAPCSRQITMPAPHRSVFLQAGCPSCRPTNSVRALLHLVTNFLLSLTVKKFWKSVNIWWSYGQEFGVLFFLTYDVLTRLWNNTHTQ